MNQADQDNHPPRVLVWQLGLGAVALVVLAVALWQIPELTVPAPEPSLAEPSPVRSVPRYDTEHPTIGYSTTATTDPIAKLQARIDLGDLRLQHAGPRGFLDSLLQALDIDSSSQTLVFSKTSLHDAEIHPATPRAIYFNDDTYVAWTQQSDLLEIASMDPVLGPVFYTTGLDPHGEQNFARKTEQCLQCHDSYSLTGGGVPRFIVGSGYTGTSGDLVSHEGWIVTSIRTSLRNRWGGWYVTGKPNQQSHLGNIVVESAEALQRLDELRIGTLANLDALLDTSAYLSNKSDIVALMVLEHQVGIQNAITRVNYDTRTALANADQGDATAASEENAHRVIEALLKALFSVGEASIPSPIAGTSGFAEQFEARGPSDRRGRSLRELDLDTKLFVYPLSFVIYSDGFDAIPEPSKQRIYSRIVAILRGEDRTGEFTHLTAEDRIAVSEILEETKPDFAAILKR